MDHDDTKLTLRQALIDLAIMTVLGVFLAVVGPFGSFTVPFAWRLVYWVGLSWGGYACYRPIFGAIVRRGRALDLPEAASWVAACLIATLPMTALVWLVGALPRVPEWPGLEAALTMYGYVLVIGAMLSGLFVLLGQRKRSTATTQPLEPARTEAQDPQSVRFLDRIPVRLGTDLVALQMEDHYIRVHTRLGNDLILLRMRDAVAELDGLDGAQVHRSWWVARSAVSAVTRDGRQVRLALHGGLEVPVARDAVAALKVSGWL